MADGHAAADAMRARLHELAQLPERAAGDVAAALEDELRAQIARGEGPDGKPWPLTQSGRKALQNAASALRVRAAGATVVATLTGPAALHHRGAVRGGRRRQILPSGKIPAPVVRAIRSVVDRHFARTMRGDT